MFKKLNYLILIGFFFSCYNHSNERNSKPELKKINDVVDQKKLAIRANEYYKNKEYLKAINCYDTLIDFDSTKGGYYFKRGYCRAMLLNNDANAIQDYQRAINHNYSEKKLAYLSIGVLYRFATKYDSALYFFNQCLNIDSTITEAIREKKEVLQILNNSK